MKSRLSIEKTKLAPGTSPEIKKLHALLCQVQVDFIQMKTFIKNKNVFMRASRDFAVTFPELLRWHAKCLETYQKLMEEYYFPPMTNLSIALKNSFDIY